MLRTRIRAGGPAGVVLSALFAGLLLVVATAELFFPSLAPVWGRRTPITLRTPYGPRIVDEATEPGRPRQPAYQYQTIVVARGDELRPRVERHRWVMAYEAERRPFSATRAISLYAFYFVVFLMLTTYLRRFGQSRMRLLRTQVGLFGLFCASLVLAKCLFLFTALSEFWIPMAALPLWVALAFDRRTAFLIEIAVAFVAISLLGFDVRLLVVLLVRGIAATLFFFNRKHPSHMIFAGAAGGLAGAACLIALTLIFEGRFDFWGDVQHGLGSNLLACVGGGVVAGGLARTLREPAERVMGHVSRDKLLDLTDLEQPLLKKMAAEAPGSWEHARAMANLAEAAAAAIGADALLTRVGAYYHDLGKSVQPKYFVENLQHGEQSPHVGLDPDVSADAIMTHVVMGTKILRDGRIPEPVVEFAYTHHGTQVVEYFWNLCREQGNPKKLTEEHFRYPGMKPQTKETAILMLVDSIEAASRTIWPPEQKKFEEMIQRIIFTKLNAGQLDESGLTLEDLRVLSSRMSMALVNMYHGRVKYPWQREAEAKTAQASAAARDVRSQMASTPPPPKAAGADECGMAPREAEPAQARAESEPSSAAPPPTASEPGRIASEEPKVHEPERPELAADENANANGEEHAGLSRDVAPSEPAPERPG